MLIIHSANIRGSGSAELAATVDNLNVIDLIALSLKGVFNVDSKKDG